MYVVPAADRDALVLKYLPLARRLARSLYYADERVEALGDLDDVRSEAVVALLRAVDGFDPSRGCRTPAGLIRQVITNHLLDLAKRRRVRAEGTDRPDLIPDPGTHHWKGDELDRVRDCLHLLPSRQQEVLEYRFFQPEGFPRLTQAAVADHFGVTRQRVDQIEAEAVAALRAILSKEVET